MPTDGIQSEPVLPDFLVIGVPRAGTTWMHQALAAHPQVGVPPNRKELHYFDRNFHKGPDWYASYFHSLDGCARIGEVTPHYLYVESLSERLKSIPTIRRLVVILRDPAERLISHYHWRVRQDGYSGTLEDFLGDYPEALAWGDYLPHLKRLGSWIDSGRLLVLVHEALHLADGVELERLADFLGIEARALMAFPRERVNVSRQPRSRQLWRFGVSAARWLRDRRMDSVVNKVRESRFRYLLETENRIRTEVRPETLARLHDHYGADVAELETLTHRRLSDYWPAGGSDWPITGRGRRTGS